MNTHLEIVDHCTPVCESLSADTHMYISSGDLYRTTQIVVSFRIPFSQWYHLNGDPGIAIGFALFPFPFQRAVDFTLGQHRWSPRGAFCFCLSPEASLCGICGAPDNWSPPCPHFFSICAVGEHLPAAELHCPHCLEGAPHVRESQRPPAPLPSSDQCPQTFGGFLLALTSRAALPRSCGEEGV